MGFYDSMPTAICNHVYNETENFLQD